MVCTNNSNKFVILTYSMVLLQDVLQKPADEFGNDNMLEELWAKRAFEHAEIHFNVTHNTRNFI